MKTLDRYVLGAFLTAFVLTFAVLSFVLTLGSLAQVAHCIMEGAAAVPVLGLALVGFHETLQWSVPLSLLFASVIVFSRLQTDNEIMALRSGGIRLVRIVRTPLAFAAVLAVAGVWFNFEIRPREHQIKRELRRQLLYASDLKKVVPGSVIDVFPNFKFVFDAWDGDALVNFQAYDKRRDGEKGPVRAARATFENVGTDLVFDLKDMTIDPLDSEGRLTATAERFRHVQKEAARRLLRKYTYKDMPTAELLAYCREGRGTAKLRMDISLRLVYALTSVVFVLVGIPLGLLVRRRRSLVGPLAALVTALVYYLLIIGVQALPVARVWRPDLLAALPAVFCSLLGLFLMRRFR